MKFTYILLLIAAILIFTGFMVFNYFNSMDGRVSAKTGEGESGNTNIHDVSMKDIDGNVKNFSDYKGKVLLIVNVASFCGYTKQYTALEQIYQKYKDSGLEILAFPCNDFGSQEPGNADEIKEFCSTKYSVSFPLFEKVSVLANKSPLFEKLTNNSVTGNSEIKWNFEKFIVGKDGNILARFRSKVTPDDPELTAVIEKALK